jgi:hypothetical protein
MANDLDNIENRPTSELLGDFCKLHLEYQAWLVSVYEDMSEHDRVVYFALAAEIDRRMPVQRSSLDDL